MKNKKDKDFDAVRMMRDIRKKLAEEYLSDPEKEEQDLKKIRKKCGIKEQQKPMV